MRSINIILCCLVLCCFGCNDKKKESTEVSVSPPSTIIENSPADSGEEITGEAISADGRRLWQKPDDVISKLGDLEDKVVADLGAGIGYFSLRLLPKSAKVIALDIDKDKVKILNGFKSSLRPALAKKLDVRLVTPDNSRLNNNETDIILIVNTVAYIDNRVAYFKELKTSLKTDGQVVIVDYKTKKMPDYVHAPPYNEREYLHVLEDQLSQAGFGNITSDDTSLEYQFMVFAQR